MKEQGLDMAGSKGGIKGGKELDKAVSKKGNERRKGLVIKGE